MRASDLDSIASTIRARGLREEDGHWRISQVHPGPLDELFERSNLSIEDVSAGVARSAVCACGEPDGAGYYAWKHNRTGEHTTPLMVEFDAEPSAVAVDGRDFLYTVFQMGDPVRARDALERCFGPAVLRYADRAWQVNDQRSRIALCNLAVYDPKVVVSHHANIAVIAGRHRTTFRNAFTVALPIESGRIARVWSPASFPGLALPDVRLSDVLAERN